MNIETHERTEMYATFRDEDGDELRMVASAKSDRVTVMICESGTHAAIFLTVAEAEAILTALQRIANHAAK